MVTMPPEIHAALEAWGKSEMRNKSQAALFLIQEGLKARGLLSVENTNTNREEKP